MRREAWFRAYAWKFLRHAELIPAIGVSWDSGYLSLDLAWLLWGAQIQWSREHET